MIGAIRSSAGSNSLPSVLVTFDGDIGRESSPERAVVGRRAATRSWRARSPATPALRRATETARAARVAAAVKPAQTSRPVSPPRGGPAAAGPGAVTP